MNPLQALGDGLQWVGRSLSGSGSGPRRVEGHGGSLAGVNYAGVPITPGRALSLTACYAAINVLSRDLASLPLDVRRRAPDGSNRVATEDPRRREILRFSPNGEMTAFRYRQSKVAHALMYGNGYSEIERSRIDGSPIALHLLDPQKTKAARSKQTGRLWYQQERGESIRAEDVVHFAPLGFDGISGYSPIRLCQQAFALGLALENFGSAFFGNGAKHGGTVKTPKRLTPEGAARLREGFERVHQGSPNAHRIAVLEEGAEFEPNTIPPEEAQFILTRQFQILEIARIYNLPPNKLGDYSQAHMSNVEESNLDYIATTLMPWCAAMENEWDLKLFVREERAQGFYTRHDMTALMRGNMAARGTFLDTMLKWGIVTPNAVAASEGFAPIGPAGDQHIIPLNMTTLENVGKPDPAKAQRSGDQP